MARVAIIGAGLVGRAWAVSFARAGHEVRLWDGAAGAAEAALRLIDGVLADLAAFDLLGGEAPAAVRVRMWATADLGAALDGADYAQESTPEELAGKRAVFALLDAAADRRTVLASSTSGLLPSAFTDHLAGRERCLVVHPINPPYLVPAAEVVPAPWTDPAVVARAATFIREAGHVPIVMRKELAGFVMNRLQGALLQEAFRLVADGYATAEDVDVGIREGLALRWSFMGPFETIDLNAPAGVRDYVARYGPMYAGLAEGGPLPDWTGPVLDEVDRDRRAALPLDRLGERQAWRDRRLMALAAHKAAAAKEIGE
jgi:3-hydroxyacyl-CoA dehydrogenase